MVPRVLGGKYLALLLKLSQTRLARNWRAVRVDAKDPIKRMAWSMECHSSVRSHSRRHGARSYHRPGAW